MDINRYLLWKNWTLAKCRHPPELLPSFSSSCCHHSPLLAILGNKDLKVLLQHATICWHRNICHSFIHSFFYQVFTEHSFCVRIKGDRDRMPCLIKKGRKSGVGVNGCMPWGQEKGKGSPWGLSLAGSCVRLPLKAEATEIQPVSFMLTIPFLLPWNKNIRGNYSVNVAIMFYSCWYWSAFLFPEDTSEGGREPVVWAGWRRQPGTEHFL